MKKIFLALLFEFVVVVSLQAADVFAREDVGILAVTSDKQNTVVAVAFEDLNRLGEVSVSNLIKTANLSPGDKIYVFANQKYTSWTLISNPNGYLQWTSDIMVEIDQHGEESLSGGILAQDVTCPVGSGVWLSRVKKPASPFVFYLYGKPVQSVTLSLQPGLTSLIANPSVNVAKPQVIGAQVGDQIVVPNDTGMPERYSFGMNNHWNHRTASGTIEQDLPTLPSGHGCWFVSVAAGNVRTIEWKSL